MRRIRNGSNPPYSTICQVQAQNDHPRQMGCGENNTLPVSVHLSMRSSMIRLSRNWSDPLFKLTSGMPGCPDPWLPAAWSSINQRVNNHPGHEGSKSRITPGTTRKNQPGNKFETCQGQETRKTFGIEHALNGQPFGELDRVPAARWSVALLSCQWRPRAAGPAQQNDRLQM